MELTWGKLLKDKSSVDEDGNLVINVTEVLKIANKDEFVSQLIPIKNHRRVLITLIMKMVSFQDPGINGALYALITPWAPESELESEIDYVEATVKYFAGVGNWSNEQEVEVILTG